MSTPTALHEAIEKAIVDHCAGGDLWLCAHIASEPFDARIAELARERDETIRKLRDPVAVHVAMLRGEIAVPPLAELLHVYGATFSDLDAANIELAKARETIRQLRAQLDEYERAPTFTYMYRFQHMGGFVWRHSSSDFNGARPVESIELIARPTRKGEA